MPKCITDTPLQDIDDEWRSLSFFEFPDDIVIEKKTIHSGRKLKNDEGHKLFQNVSNFVLNVLSLPHANADCERIFSSINAAKTKSRNKLKIKR